ncbi:hypothetical protein NDK47_24220 [Brevibacillus ruminantium]|uniref:DNA (cytosine-5-)-methyltransferase n=1 Tax=Brevibacillus ruminantium TaxID=2950604 RepID=A0ABY4WDQ5_9BACL|nr:hypothetical protein [Brevibacillus ruminantium]USG65193.1 hypothetical protein NDK47_24220 [Brevibacillus ruminantium]
MKLWPTPQARDYRSADNQDSPRVARKAEQGWSPNLNDAVKLWPTPRANDAEKRGDINADDPRNGLPAAVKLWPTPAAQDAKNATLPPSQIDRDTVPGAVMREMKLWPTPTASQDWKPIRPLAPSEANGTHGTMLVGAVGDTEPHNVGGQLNPAWVECLMGFPIGWTDLDCDELDESWIDTPRWPAGIGQEQHEWEPPRVATGVKDRVARLKALGNAVVPAQVYPILAAIKQVHEAI